MLHLARSPCTLWHYTSWCAAASAHEFGDQLEGVGSICGSAILHADTPAQACASLWLCCWVIRVKQVERRGKMKEWSPVHFLCALSSAMPAQYPFCTLLQMLHCKLMSTSLQAARCLLRWDLNRRICESVAWALAMPLTSRCSFSARLLVLKTLKSLKTDFKPCFSCMAKNHEVKEGPCRKNPRRRLLRKGWCIIALRASVSYTSLFLSFC